MIRKCTESDIDWLIELGKQRYGESFTNYEKTRQWGLRAVNHPDCLLLRGENAALVSVKSFVPFYDNPRVIAMLFYGNIWELVAIFREAKKWAKDAGADKVEFSSWKKHDISALAKRLGADAEFDCYSLKT